MLLTSYHVLSRWSLHSVCAILHGMAIEWDDVRVFQSAVRAGDYSNAARKLDMDRTTVGRRFARLERATGRSLWEQAATGYQPTEAGRAVIRAAETMEQAMAQLAADLIQGSADSAIAGPIRVAGTAGLASLLLPAMAKFLARHPAIAIEVVGARESIAAVQQRHADIGFAIARSKPRDLAGIRLTGFEQRRYVGTEGTDRPIGWGHAMMLANPQPWARLNTLPQDRPGLEVDSMAAMHEAVRAGLGSAWLWRAVGDKDSLMEAMADEAPATAEASLWIVYRSDLEVEPAVAALRDAADDIVGQFIKAT
jgi:DNA-binding transcriptional LysR family regulator